MGQLGFFYYLSKKHTIISCSHDKTVKVFQLPIYYPGEYMRNDHNKDSKEEKENENHERNFICSKKVIDNVQERIISQTAVLKYKNKENKELEEWEKDCEDLDGWDN